MVVCKSAQIKNQLRGLRRYRDHYIVDGGKARIILSALVAPASIMDNTPLLDLLDWVCSRWLLEPKIAVGDAKYGTVPNIVGLDERGVKAYLPIPDLSKRTGYYPSDSFSYDAKKDHYICPQKHKLPLMARRMSEEKIVYRANADVCNACSVKEKCTGSKSGNIHQESLIEGKVICPAAPLVTGIGQMLNPRRLNRYSRGNSANSPAMIGYAWLATNTYSLKQDRG